MKPYDDPEGFSDFELSNGRRFYANMHTIGLCDGDLVYGSDGCINDDFTNAERAEIADYMIEQWQQYRAKYA